VERQRALLLAARFFRLASGEASAQSQNAASHTDGMIVSTIRAEHYRRLGELEMAAAWLEHAAMAQPAPLRQKALIFPTNVQLSPEGAIVIDSTTPGWSVRRDSQTNSKVEQGDTIVLSWEAEAEQRKRGVFVWSSPFNIPYHHTSVLNLKIEPGCLFILETVIDGESTRHLRHRGTGEWEEISVPVEGEYLTYLYALLDAESDERTHCQMEIKRISFELDESGLVDSEVASKPYSSKT
jgi:hypothetical protein